MNSILDKVSDTIFDAKTAKEKSERNNESVVTAEIEKQLFEVKKGIDSAVKRGDDYCIINFKVHPSIRYKLFDKGYKIQIDYTTSVGHFTKIIWNE